MRLERILRAVVAEVGADGAQVVDGRTGTVVAALGQRRGDDIMVLLAGTGGVAPKAGDLVMRSGGAVHVLRGLAGLILHVRLKPGADVTAARRALAEPGLHAGVRAGVTARAAEWAVPRPRPSVDGCPTLARPGQHLGTAADPRAPRDPAPPAGAESGRCLLSAAAIGGSHPDRSAAAAAPAEPGEGGVVAGSRPDRPAAAPGPAEPVPAPRIVIPDPAPHRLEPVLDASAVVVIPGPPAALPAAPAAAAAVPAPAAAALPDAAPGPAPAEAAAGAPDAAAPAARGVTASAAGVPAGPASLFDAPAGDKRGARSLPAPAELDAVLPAAAVSATPAPLFDAAPAPGRAAAPTLTTPASLIDAPVALPMPRMAAPTAGAPPRPTTPAPRRASPPVAVATLTRGALPALASIGPRPPRVSFGALAVKALGAEEAERLGRTSWSRDSATLRRVLDGLRRLA